MLTGPEKARENRLRRLAERRNGASLSRARRRDRDSWDYAVYQLIPDPEHPLWLYAHEDDLQPRSFEALDEVEAFLLGEQWAQNRVEERAADAGLTIERAMTNGSRGKTIWLSSQEGERRWGPFYSYDEVENYFRAAPEQRPRREWRRMPEQGTTPDSGS